MNIHSLKDNTTLSLFDSFKIERFSLVFGDNLLSSFSVDSYDAFLDIYRKFFDTFSNNFFDFPQVQEDESLLKNFDRFNKDDLVSINTDSLFDVFNFSHWFNLGYYYHPPSGFRSSRRRDLTHLYYKHMYSVYCSSKDVKSYASRFDSFNGKLLRLEEASKLFRSIISDYEHSYRKLSLHYDLARSLFLMSKDEFLSKNDPPYLDWEQAMYLD